MDWHGHGQVLLRFPSLPNMKVPLLPSEGGQVRGNTLSPGNPGKQSKRQQYNILISYNYIYMHILLELEYTYIIFLIYRKYRHIYIYFNIHVYLWLVACHTVYLGNSNAQNAQRQMLHIVHGKWRRFSSQLSHNSLEKMQLTHNPVNVRY